MMDLLEARLENTRDCYALSAEQNGKGQAAQSQPRVVQAHQRDHSFAEATAMAIGGGGIGDNIEDVGRGRL